MTISDRADQLARIAAKRPPAREFRVAIYQFDRGFSIWVWLCRPCLAKRKADGWDVREERPGKAHLTCDECGCAA